METTFENIKIGDKVWSLFHGWGRVIEFSAFKQLGIEFGEERNYFLWFEVSGTLKGSVYHRQVLFWDEIQIVAPPRPKRKVKKQLEIWANIYPGEEWSPHWYVYSSKENADLFQKSDKSRIDCIQIIGEYEVEE